MCENGVQEVGGVLNVVCWVKDLAEECWVKDLAECWVKDLAEVCLDRGEC